MHRQAHVPGRLPSDIDWERPESNEPKCEECGLSFSDHSGVQGTCGQLQAAIAIIRKLYDEFCPEDSYGVSKSEFRTCKRCHTGGSPTRPWKHADSCEMLKVEEFLYGSQETSPVADDPPWLPELIEALGWQGGTIHQAIKEVRTIVSENVRRKQREQEGHCGSCGRALVRAAVRAFAELNAIRARDGVPYTHNGWKSDVQEEYFSSVVDELDEAVKAATGRSAHCHPELYA